MKSHQYAPKEHGFTLLEVMVALFIFAVTGTAILKTTVEHLNSLGTLEEITFATWVANNRLTQLSLESTVKWPPQRRDIGEIEMVDRTWYWRQLVEDTPDSDLKKITVFVSLNEDLDDSITSVTTLIAKPSQS